MDIFYILDKDNNVVPSLSPSEWFDFFCIPERRKVARTELSDGVLSTVFLGIGAGFNKKGKPLVFETMFFGQDTEDDEKLTRRFATWDEALAYHQSIVAKKAH